MVRAQRSYQITKYRVNNLITPDEIIMPFKWHNVIIHSGNATGHYILPAFGIRVGDLAEISGWAQNAANFKQVEFLSGSTTIYAFDNTMAWQARTIGQVQGLNFLTTPAVTAYKTARRWTDQDNKLVEELRLTPPDDKHTLWTISAEQPGVSVNFLNSYQGQKNSQKYKWKFNKSSFKGLKYDPTGFSVDFSTTRPDNDIIPNNMAQIDFLVDLWNGSLADTQLSGALTMFISYKFYVKFKGRQQ